MKPWIRRSLFALLSLLVLLAVAAFGAVSLGERKLARQVPVAVAPVGVPTDATALERGRYLFASRGCADCHGADGGGHVVIDDHAGMLVRAPDITSGGATAAYLPVDWVRTLRHGVKPDGRAVLIMPSEEYARLTDADVGALVAYARSLPPRHGGPAELRLPPLVRALYGLGVVRDASEKIDHTLPPAQPVTEGATAAWGAYVANACIGCHGARLEGGRNPGAPPAWPPAARLRPGPGNALDHYPDAAAFAAMFKTGRRPDGSAVSPVMPFTSLREMNAVDVEALYLHLRGLAN